MIIKLDPRGWTAGQRVRPCVICGQPAILRSPRDRPRHRTCALAWGGEHQDQAAEHRPQAA